MEQNQELKAPLILKVFIVVFLTFLAIILLGNFYKVQATTLTEILENQNKTLAEDKQGIKSKATNNLLITSISLIASIAYLGYLLYYVSKLAKEINEPKGLLYLSLLVPLVGLILYCVYIRKAEKLGNACGKLAILGITMPIILSTILSIGAFINNINSGKIIA